MSRPWARPCAAALFWACVLASLPPLISPASPRRGLLGLDIQHLDLDRRDDLRSAPDQDAADGEDHGDDRHPDERAAQPPDAAQGGAQGDHDRGRDGRQRSRAPHDRGVLRQHYKAPEGWTATLLTREDVPRAVQEPVAAPLPRCGYPVRFRKGITGLSLAVEGLLVKHITKSLSLSLPDRTQFMTNSRLQPLRGPPARSRSAFRTPRAHGIGWRNPRITRHFPAFSRRC